MARPVTHRYEDPLDRIWIGCAERVGLRVVRDPHAFATTDGKGTLAIATPEGLDADDCLAQMIFHELCHSLVQGPRSLYQRDWGLENEAMDLLSGPDAVREHACLRLQALLLRPLGLRRALGPTTDFRAYYDALPEDPLAGDDPAIPLAIAAAGRVHQAPWNPHVSEALAATAAIARQVATYGTAAPGSLWSLVDAPVKAHRAGFPMPAAGSTAARETCGSCAWGPTRGKAGRCRASGERTAETEPACERWEPEALDCFACGACCREAFHTVLLTRNDVLRKTRPDLVTMIDGRPEMPRPEGNCPALERGALGYACTVYDQRPRSCRDFAVAGDACLLARQRVGMTR
ncbi:MAG: YkgJ family cysteine cluster protein [Sandaracinus sp.]